MPPMITWSVIISHGSNVHGNDGCSNYNNGIITAAILLIKAVIATYSCNITYTASITYSNMYYTLHHTALTEDWKRVVCSNLAEILGCLHGNMDAFTSAQDFRKVTLAKSLVIEAIRGSNSCTCYSCNMGMSDLPDMYARVRRPQARVSLFSPPFITPVVYNRKLTSQKTWHGHIC